MNVPHSSQNSNSLEPVFEGKVTEAWFNQFSKINTSVTILRQDFAGFVRKLSS